jgi:hypothetical protein
LWASFVVGIPKAGGDRGGAIQLAILSASICVICGFSWVGGLCDFFVSLCLCVCDVCGRIWVYLGYLWAIIDRSDSRVVGGKGNANKATNAICVYLRDLRFLLGGWVGLVSWW